MRASVMYGWRQVQGAGEGDFLRERRPGSEEESVPSKLAPNSLFLLCYLRLFATLSRFSRNTLGHFSFLAGCCQ
jgi:hypothetical protein